MSPDKPLEPKRRRSRLVSIARCVARITGYGASFGVVLWMLGRVGSDRWMWSQWLLWIPTPLALLALAVRLAVTATCDDGAIRRRRVVRWGIVTAAVLAFFLFVEHRFQRFAPSAPSGIRFVHWNPSESGPQSFERTQDTVKALNGDVTILTNGGYGHWGRLATEWLGPGAQGRVLRPYTVITRLPILEFRTLVANGGVRIALLRLDARESLDRDLTLWLVDLPSTPRASRWALGQRVRAFIDAADPPEPDLIVGDLNLTRGGRALRALFPEHRHAFLDAGHGYAATFPRAVPLYHIDHILLGPRVAATDYETINPGHGRHSAQVAHIR